MKPDCIFCRIINREAHGHIVYEDGSVIAIMDANPSKPGHTLVIPKAHVPDFYNLEEDVYSRLMLTVKHLSIAVKRVTSPKKVGLLIVGFGVPHTHVHIIPLDHTDDIATGTSFAPPPTHAPDHELADMAAHIAAAALHDTN